LTIVIFKGLVPHLPAVRPGATPNDGREWCKRGLFLFIISIGCNRRHDQERSLSQLTPHFFRFGEDIQNTLSAALPTKSSYPPTGDEPSTSASFAHHVVFQDRK
jgi:hypothetical protein